MAPGTVSTDGHQSVEALGNRLVGETVLIAGTLRDPVLESGHVRVEQLEIGSLTARAATPPRGGIEDDVDPPVGAAQVVSISSNVCTPA